MGQHLKKGSKVHWTWGAHEAEGVVDQRFDEKVTRTIKGSKVTRNASEDEPAYLVKQKGGGRALKSESELKRGGA